MWIDQKILAWEMLFKLVNHAQVNSSRYKRGITNKLPISYTYFTLLL